MNSLRRRLRNLRLPPLPPVSGPQTDVQVLASFDRNDAILWDLFGGGRSPRVFTPDERAAQLRDYREFEEEARGLATHAEVCELWRDRLRRAEGAVDAHETPSKLP